MICYCKREIADDDRTIQLDLTVNWGDTDIRDTQEPKHYVFHSFACIAQWANDRALSHDSVVVREGAPA